MENSIPVLAATDRNTDIKDVLEKSNRGLWCESRNIGEFIKKAKEIASNKERRIQMGTDGKNNLGENYDVTKTVNIVSKYL